MEVRPIYEAWVIKSNSALNGRTMNQKRDDQIDCREDLSNVPRIRSIILLPLFFSPLLFDLLEFVGLAQGIPEELLGTR